MADFDSKYSGEQVEALLDQVASGNAGGGGGGGIAVETDPIFSASPAASITEEKITEWNSKSAQGEKGDKGDTGVGVQSVAQTTTSNADGGSNVVTVTLTDGTKSTFTVKNGSKGSQGIQGEQGPKGDTGDTGAQGPKGDKGDTGAAGANGTNGKDGADGADGATFTPSVDSAGNLSWSNDKGLANPPTVNIKGPKGDKGDAGEGGGGTSGGGDNSVEELDLMGGADLVISELLPNKKYVVWTNFIPEHPSLAISSLGGNLSEEEATIDSFYALIITDSQEGTGESVQVSLYLPDDGDWKWANGKITQMKLGKTYEMSIIRHNDYGGLTYYITIAEY